MDILYEDSEKASIKYISFIGNSDKRFDLAIIITDRFFGKILVLDIQLGHSAIIGKDDLDEPNFLSDAFKLETEEAEDLYEYLINYF